LLDYDAGVWHAFVDGVGLGQRYGYRATDPYDPGGVRCNPSKLKCESTSKSLSRS
jgi:isoamylase